MTGRTHDLISFASLLTAAVTFQPASLNFTTTVSCLVGSVVGALIPDMDQATNRLWDMLPAGNIVGRVLRHLMLEHRTISHSILGLFVFYKILIYLVPKIFNPSFINVDLVTASIMIGMVSHLFADSLTKEGVPLFFPFKFKVGIPPLKALRMTTGKFFENVIVFPGVIVYIFYLVYQKHNEFLALIRLIKN